MTSWELMIVFCNNICCSSGKLICGNLWLNNTDRLRQTKKVGRFCWNTALKITATELGTYIIPMRCVAIDMYVERYSLCYVWFGFNQIL